MIKKIYDADIIFEIIVCGKHLKNFKMNFVLDVQEYFENNGYITQNQYDSLLTLYFEWDMESMFKQIQQEDDYFHLHNETCDINLSCIQNE